MSLSRNELMSLLVETHTATKEFVCKRSTMCRLGQFTGDTSKELFEVNDV